MLVYLIVNNENEKRYVGQTAQSLRTRWLSHLKDARTGSQFGIHRAIRKYGTDVFDVSVLAEANNKSSLDNLEKLFIILLQSETHGYNMTSGGRGGMQSAEVRARLSDSLKGRIFSKEHRANLSITSRGRQVFLGRKHTAETCARISATKKFRSLVKVSGSDSTIKAEDLKPSEQMQ